MKIEDFMKIKKDDLLLIIDDPKWEPEEGFLWDDQSGYPFWGWNPAMEWGKVLKCKKTPNPNSKEDLDYVQSLMGDQGLYYSCSSIKTVITKEENPEYFL